MTDDKTVLLRELTSYFFRENQGKLSHSTSLTPIYQDFSSLCFICFQQACNTVNSLLQNVLVYPYHLDYPISSFRGFGRFFSLLLYFAQKFVLAYSLDSDQALRTAVSNTEFQRREGIADNSKIFFSYLSMKTYDVIHY